MPPLRPERKYKLELSSKETHNLKLRDIRCPRCNFLILKVYSDISGHLLPKCPKCKSEDAINLAYFRRQRGIARLKENYYSK